VTVSPAADLDEVLTRLVRDVPDFPEPGVVFKDISPLLADHAAFSAVITELARAGRDADGTSAVDKVAGIEARGFIFAAPIALNLQAGFVPVRKAGKLPGPTYEQSYSLEYGDATLQVHQDAFQPGERVLLVDDVLATGGTLQATAALVERAGATVHAMSVLIELGFLSGRDRVAAHSVAALLTV
jgi:adenine phosphoribosyltransferase